jgi:hypothetical protein
VHYVHSSRTSQCLQNAQPVCYAQVYFAGTCIFNVDAAPPSKRSTADLPLLSLDALKVATAERALRFLQGDVANVSPQKQAKPAGGRYCIPCPSGRRGLRRAISTGEAREKLRVLRAMVDPALPHDAAWADQVLEVLKDETRAEKRHPKHAPLTGRVRALLLKMANDARGEWMTLPPAKALAAQLQVSERSFRDALAQLRSDPDCPLAFHSEARRDADAPSRRGRCVRIALKSWLRYDGLPLLYAEDGTHRGLRTDLGPSGALLTRIPEPAPTNGKICPLDSNGYALRGIPADKSSTPDGSPEATPASTTPAAPALKARCPRNLANFAWALARAFQSEHFGDWTMGNPFQRRELPRWQFALGLVAIQAMILEGLGEGLDYLRQVKPALEKAVWEASAARRDGVARNPGGLARAVYRRRLANLVAKTELDRSARIQRMQTRVAAERHAVRQEALHRWGSPGKLVETARCPVGFCF